MEIQKLLQGIGSLNRSRGEGSKTREGDCMKRTAKIASAVAAASLVAALGAGVAFAQSSNGAGGVARICNGSATCASSQICAGGNGACAGGTCGYADENGDGVCDNRESCENGGTCGAGNGVCVGNGSSGAGYGNGFGACAGNGGGNGQANGTCNGAGMRAGWGHSR
jgi:hypothetical protein